MRKSFQELTAEGTVPDFHRIPYSIHFPEQKIDHRDEAKIGKYHQIPIFSMIFQ